MNEEKARARRARVITLIAAALALFAAPTAAEAAGPSHGPRRDLLSTSEGQRPLFELHASGDACSNEPRRVSGAMPCPPLISNSAEATSCSES